MGSSDDPRIKYGLSCPTGGDFFICSSSKTRFIGCCGINPCIGSYNGTCPAGELFSASFSADRGAELLAAQGCMEPYTESSWFTCADALPPFLGCCRNNPCNGGCRPGNLLEAVLSDDARNASQFLIPTETTTTASASTASETSSETGSTSASFSTASVGPTATSEAGPGKQEQGGIHGMSRTWLIVGVSLAGVVILLALITLYLWLTRRGEDRQMNEREQESGNSPSAELGSSAGVFQGPMTCPGSGISPVGGCATTPCDQNRRSQEPQELMSKTAASDTMTSPHMSQISELEGSSGIVTALRPDVSGPYRGFDGRE